MNGVKSTRRLILVTYNQFLVRNQIPSDFTKGINIISIIWKDAIYSQIWLQTQAVRLSHMVDNLHSRRALVFILNWLMVHAFFSFRANLQRCIRVHRQSLIYGLTWGQSFYWSFSVCTTECVSR